jgi:predicted Fe-Mo cluster-binding NifX family protein
MTREENGLKIAVPSDGADFDAKVGDRLGLSPYLLIVDPESRDFEVVRSPRESGSGAGMQMVALIIAKRCNVLLAKWCSPTAEKYLSAHGVGIVTGMSGTVAEVLEKFLFYQENCERETKSRLIDVIEKTGFDRFKAFVLGG